MALSEDEWQELFEEEELYDGRIRVNRTLVPHEGVFISEIIVFDEYRGESISSIDESNHDRLSELLGDDWESFIQAENEYQSNLAEEESYIACPNCGEETLTMSNRHSVRLCTSCGYRE